MALAGPAVPEERPRHITVPIGAGHFVYLPIDPTPLRLAHVPLVNGCFALRRWVDTNPEKRVLFWRADWQVLLFNLWHEALLELWGRDAPDLNAKLTRLDFVLTERLAHLFDPFDMIRWRLHYLPADRWFHDVHLCAVVPAVVDLRQPELPMDDAQEVPTPAPTDPPKQQQSAHRSKPASELADNVIAEKLIADGLLNLDPARDEPSIYKQCEALGSHIPGNANKERKRNRLRAAVGRVSGR